MLPGITLESTSQGGSFAVPAGNTLYAQPSRTATDPAQAKPYKADRYVAASQVNELPSVEGKACDASHICPAPLFCVSSKCSRNAVTNPGFDPSVNGKSLARNGGRDP